MATKIRIESNLWLRHQARGIQGHVLSVGSGADTDGEGGRYRGYFKNCSSYKTSDLDPARRCDLVVDIRSMTQILDESFNCVFCNAVLEHVDDFLGALREITRILRVGGILLLGLPLRYEIHMAPSDYWRFTEHGIRYMLHRDYEILNLTPMDTSVPRFPGGYWVKARKLKLK